MFFKTRQNLSATIRNFNCEQQDKAKSFNENNNIAQIFEKRIFHYASDVSFQNIESHNFDIENHIFDIENYQTETVKKQEKDYLISKVKCLPGC